MIRYGSAFSGGAVTLPPSKSVAHRALLAAALSGGSCTVSPIDPSKDMLATLSAIRALGCQVAYSEEKKQVNFTQIECFSHVGQLDCIESGSTLRFLLPIAAAISGDWLLTGTGRLPQRPLTVYETLLPQHGVSYQPHSAEFTLPLKISGKLTPGVFALPGNISSQFITGLLFALPLLNANSEIKLTTPLESVGYVDLTLAVLRDFGITVTKTADGWFVPGNQSYRAQNYHVEGDWSQAAFFLCMAALSPTGEQVALHGLSEASLQGDKACVSIFERFGLQTKWENGILLAQNFNFKEEFGGLSAQTIDVSQIPDMVPALAVCAALSKGTTRLLGAGRLRLKESDRLAVMEHAINTLGGQCTTTADTMEIVGVPSFHGGTVLGQNDHRIVMAMAAAALRSTSPICVTDERSIEKSYPSFFEDFCSLGGQADVINLG